MRAYSDVHDISATLEEKKTHAERGSLICVISSTVYRNAKYMNVSKCNFSVDEKILPTHGFNGGMVCEIWRRLVERLNIA